MNRDDDIEVSVILPCLNEERTLASCIQRAWKALASSGLCGEVIVADNGSTDRSRQIAAENDARVVLVRARGYGNALHRGIQQARGRYVVLLDADMSYEFDHIPRFVERLKAGADLVMGSRFRGRIDPRAMPRLHRYLGTPVLTFLANLFFGLRISDINCGMRGLRRDLFERLRLRAGGMEFASELVIKARLLKAKIEEIPTDLHPDQRGRKPHLSSFRDGWRHLRFMLLFCPTWLFLVPGLAMGLGGIIVIIAILFDVCPYVGFFTSLVSLAATTLGVQTTILGIIARRISHMKRWYERDDFLQRLLSRTSLEQGLAAGLAATLVGMGILGYTCLRIWRFMHSADYVLNNLDLPSIKLALLGTTFTVVGLQLFFSSFFLSLLNIETLDEQN